MQIPIGDRFEYKGKQYEVVSSDDPCTACGLNQYCQNPEARESTEYQELREKIGECFWAFRDDSEM